MRTSMTFGSAAAGYCPAFFICLPLRVIIAMKLKELERLFLRALCVIQVCLIIYGRKSQRAGRVFLFFFLERKTEKEISFRIGYLSPSDIFN
jgi:hypothetical protein